MKQARVARELTPIDQRPIHGVTFDGKWVWFARDDEVIGFDPQAERVVRRFAIPGACSGTAFDGEHLYQLTHDAIVVIDPVDGRIVRSLPAPSDGHNTGMAWSDGYLWVGQYRATRIHKLDARTGELVRTLRSDRFVTGVSCLNGQLWHAVGGEGDAELRRLAPDGTVEETYRVPVEAIAGLEATQEGFWCAGEQGRLRFLTTSDSSE